ncbi:GAF and ANTAR domain-containing protein [Kineococcus sp. SYSU DK006]|uniref:GAF and ANTAR domain-containing protein n=1 Tax=Kineococcus sp. SYSU DK006 TaxID=3383127 RepID=UPI003D7DFE25
MDTAEQFRTAWTPEAARLGPDLLPVALARACAAVLAVDAAGLSLMGREERVPLGASEPAASTAEQWQFTVGEGPCFTAFERAEPVVADEAGLRSRWPALHDELRRSTPFRSVVALPLGLGELRIGAVDLYWTGPRPAASFDLAAAQVVAGLVHEQLLLTAAGVDPDDPSAGPAWQEAPAARRRRGVWAAVGLSCAVLGLQGTDALALLRARAYGSGQPLEEVAEAIVTGRVPVQVLQQQVGG